MKKVLREVVIVAYGRTAIAQAGKKGAFRDVHPVDYAGICLRGVLDKIPQLDPNLIEDLVLGCSKPEEAQAANPGRAVALRAGLPHTVPGQTITRFCSSGLQSMSTAANMIMTGQQEIVVAGGMESMTMIPPGYHANSYVPSLQEMDPGLYMAMGLTAENVGDKYGISRLEMDAFSLQSHQRAAAAQDNGYFDAEIIPVEGTDLEGNKFIFDKDQGIRRNTSMESLAALKTVFKENGKVTAGSSSQRSDGAGFVVLMTPEKAEEIGLKPIAKMHGFSVAGVDPAFMGEGPIYAVPKIMQLTGFTLADMDVIELNEAFAAQAIPCMRILGLDPEKTNPNGGAIALGHPLGATGAFLTCKALNHLERINGKYALITMCIGGGQGAAAIFERL